MDDELLQVGPADDDACSVVVASVAHHFANTCHTLRYHSAVSGDVVKVDALAEN